MKKGPIFLNPVIPAIVLTLSYIYLNVETYQEVTEHAPSHTVHQEYLNVKSEYEKTKEKHKDVFQEIIDYEPEPTHSFVGYWRAIQETYTGEREVIPSIYRSHYHADGIHAIRMDVIPIHEIDKEKILFVKFLNRIPEELIAQTNGLEMSGVIEDEGGNLKEVTLFLIVFDDELRSNWREWRVEDLDDLLTYTEV